MDDKKLAALDENIFPQSLPQVGVPEGARPSGSLIPSNVAFRREPFSLDLVHELIPLLVDHYQEIAHYKDIPLDVDWDAYRRMDEAKSLRIYTSRQEGVIIGYACFLVRRNPHYQTSLSAVSDVVFIRKDKRGFGWRFIRWCDAMLKAEGVQVVYHHLKAAHDWSKILVRDGYELQDYIFSKRLDR